MEDRYYVQHLTEQVFVVRERMSADEEPGPDDRMVQSFAVRHDAYLYASRVNALQRNLDEDYGHWAQHASRERQTELWRPLQTEPTSRKGITCVSNAHARQDICHDLLTPKRG